MPNLRISAPGLSRSRRLVALALFALQGAIAVSPLWEARFEAVLASHAERKGIRHPGMHNDSTCGICAVRSLSASVPVRTAHFGTAPVLRTAWSAEPIAAPSRELARTNLSRAPPPLTG